MNTPTPRTDAAHKHYRYRSKVSGLIYETIGAAGDCESLEYVQADFARTLERETEALKARVKELEFSVEYQKNLTADVVQESKRTSQKWMDGINEVCGVTFNFEDSCGSPKFDKWVADLLARVKELERELQWTADQLATARKERDRLEEEKAILTDEELTTLCRRLERERDEARDKLSAHMEIDAGQLKQIDELVIERDDYKKNVQFFSTVKERIKEREALKAERDTLAAQLKEAREKLEDEKHPWWHRSALAEQEPKQAL